MGKTDLRKREDNLNGLANGIDKALEELYQIKTGFVLLIIPFGSKERMADYVSNIQRKEIPLTLRQIAERFEKKEIVGKTEGEA